MIIPDAIPSGLDNPFTTDCTALPGAGVYAFDLFQGFEDPFHPGNFNATGLANDDALSGIFGTENDLDPVGPDNISGYRDATGAEASFKVRILEDAP